MRAPTAGTGVGGGREAQLAGPGNPRRELAFAAGVTFEYGLNLVAAAADELPHQGGDGDVLRGQGQEVAEEF